ncbi:MAG: hypothetical protein M3O46_02880, partial [Myxococcota bacterium]|nr:hypothetical protein [Myxococcota bacterium]
PVDPGHHHVQATAPGYTPFSATVTLATDAARETVVVPALTRTSEQPELTGAGPGTSANGLRYSGIAVGGLGLVGVAIGTIFGVRAIGLQNDSMHDCGAQTSICGPAGTSSRHDAQWAGNVSTVAFVAGGILLAGGVTMFVLGKPREARGITVRAVPLMSGREVGIGFEGAFR